MQEDNTTATAEDNQTTADTTQTTETAADFADAAATDARQTAETTEQIQSAEPEEEEEITYHAVQKDNNVTAIWEMQGRKHLRTIDPRSREGSEILRLFTEEEGEEQQAA